MYEPDPEAPQNKVASEFYNVQHKTGVEAPKETGWVTPDKSILKKASIALGIGVVLAIISAITNIGGSIVALLSILIIAGALVCILGWLFFTVAKHNF